MLFDLRGRGRRNTIKIIYVALAFLMGGGLVLFGIGGNTNGGLVDALTGGGGGASSGEKLFAKQQKAELAHLRTNPQDEASWVRLIRAQVNLAGAGDRFDASTGAYSAAGKTQLRAAAASWKKYEALNPKNSDDEASVASRIVQAYGALGDTPNLIDAQEIVAQNRNAKGPYLQLAQYAYAAGQTRKGELAGKKALELADPTDRASVQGELDSYKQPAATGTPTP